MLFRSIGHPMQLDEPLEKVVAGTWDREAFAKEFTEQQQAEALMMKVQKEVGALLKQRKFPAALEKFDALTSDIKNPEMKMQFTMMKLNLHQIASSPKEEVAKTLTSAIAQAGEASKKNPMMANQIAWTIYEMTEQGKIEKNEAVLKDALNLATSAVGKMDGNSKGATLDTIAHLHHMLGNLQDAIKAQEEAVKLGGGQQDAEIKAFLEELKEELKAKK